MNKKTKDISLAVLSGVLTFLAFPPFEFSFLGWICLVPILLVIKEKKPKDAACYSFLTGVVFFAGLLYWLTNVTVPGMIILVFTLASIYGLFGILAAYVFRYSKNLLLLPFIWVLLEYVRSWLFTGFPWGLLGYSQYKIINLIQISDITGAYGVSFLLVAFNVAIFALFVQSKRKVAYTAIALFFLITATTYGICRLNGYYIDEGLRVSIVQGNIPQRHKWNAEFAEDIIAKYVSLTKEAAAQPADLVIWPETSYPYLVEKGDNPAEEISALAASLKTPILAGFVYQKGDGYYNSAAIFNREGEIGNVHHKIHLVPFGEYIPLAKYLTPLRSYIDKPIGNFLKGDKYTLFPIRSTASSLQGDGTRVRQTSFYKFGVLICFEDVFPYVARKFTQNGADFLVNITNDAWFGKTAAPRQHLQASVFRAVENRVPVIRSANTGISCFIDPVGRVSSSVTADGQEIFVDGAVTGKVGKYGGRSFYTTYGDVFVYFCIFMLMFLILAERFYRIRRTNH